MLAPMSRFCDALLAWLKWPIAVLAALALPGAARAFGHLALVEARHPAALVPLALGAGGWLALWLLVLRRRFAGSFFSTLEHELTHALFALATFHPIVDLGASWSSGGHVRYRGGTNWLIAVAPYFFPTLAIAVALGTAWLPHVAPGPGHALLGAAFGYHLTSTWRETHAGQPDLREAGRLFSILFLPSANLVACGLVLGGALGGRGAMAAFWSSTAARTTALATALWHAAAA
jgi:hypothetical protein